MNKLPIFEWFASQGDVLVTVNTQFENVDIPGHLKRQELVDFILGETPTPKMSVDEHGVHAPMRFSGALFNCYFPWNSVVQMSSEDAVIQFRNTTEPDAPAKKESSAGSGKVAKRSNPENRKERPNLRLIK